MKETVTLTTRDQTRIVILNRILDGQLTAIEAADMLSLSVRQVRRVLAAYREDGVAAVIHGNRGRSPAHTLPPDRRQQIITLAQTRYAGVNDQHLSELLAEHEGIEASRSAVRRILRDAGIASPRTRRPPTHRQRRERKPQPGMLLQLDASPHAWLAERGPRLSIVAAIDDATGTVVGAVFRLQEDAHGYFQVLQQVVTTVGVPLAVYHDRHSIFRVVNQKETLDEQLAGEREPTQFGRLLRTLGIASIAAHSPQAKGRVERLFGTLQDRLVVELRLADISTIDEANTFLQDYLPRFNARFAVVPTDPASAYQPLDSGLPLERTFAFVHQRTVAADNTIAFTGRRLQLLADPQRASYARCRVTVHDHLDGQLSVTYQGRLLEHRLAPADAPTGTQLAPPPLVVPDASDGRPDGSTQPRHRPAADHPWRTRRQDPPPAAVS